jgi:hypothetical protein
MNTIRRITYLDGKWWEIIVMDLRGSVPGFPEKVETIPQVGDKIIGRRGTGCMPEGLTAFPSLITYDPDWDIWEVVEMKGENNASR